MSGLTNKQRMFVEAYLECFNATEAARRAGYQGNDATLGAVGYENLRKPQIAVKIRERLQESAMSADEVMQRLAEQARGDVGDFIAIDEKGDFVIDWTAARGKTHLIRSLKHTSHGIAVELYDAQSALDKLARTHSLYADNVKHTGEIEVVYKGNTDPTKLVDDS
jgi:phage terminase small subunit